MSTLRWAVSDGWAVTRRDLIHWRRQPAQVVIGLLFPVLLVLMFGYLFGGGMAVPGGGDYKEFLLPGLFAMTMLFGVESTFVAVAGDAAKGVTDRFRAMPMSSSAVVVGRAGADMAYSAVGLAVMLACGLAVGWVWRSSLAEGLAAIGLLLLLRFALVWMGVYLGLATRSPESVVAFQILVWPLGFLSNAFVSPDTMPAWLAAVAEWNPLSATAAAARDLFGNPLGVVGDSWVAQHSVLMATVWPVVLIAVFFPLSVRRYRRLGD